MRKIYGVIGDPIAHSMSPEIHNDAFQRENIDAVYHHFHVKSENLADAVKGMKAIGVAGFNVTVPHKTEIIPLLDEVDELAKAIGAVNTVVLKDNRYIGYNTDGRGFYKSLAEATTGDMKAKKVLVLGAGGAARAIYFTLVKEGVKEVDIANRTMEKASSLIAECPYERQSIALTMSDAQARAHEYDIIIQTTSIGMTPNVEQSPILINSLKKDGLVSDIVYNPLKTKLLLDSESKGAKVQNGVGMFVNQAALAFEIWTGVVPDTEKMKQIVLDKLGGQVC